MKKDRFGICIPFYAVLAFVLAMLGQTLLGGLLLGFVTVPYTHLSLQIHQTDFRMEDTNVGPPHVSLYSDCRRFILRINTNSPLDSGILHR